MTNGKDLAHSTDSRDHGPVRGLTKREAFAMAAMQGILSGEECPAMSREGVARFAVGMADELIAALNKPQEAKA